MERKSARIPGDCLEIRAEMNRLEPTSFHEAHKAGLVGSYLRAFASSTAASLELR